jgi:hypothetical protein
MSSGPGINCAKSSALGKNCAAILREKKRHPCFKRFVSDVPRKGTTMKPIHMPFTAAVLVGLTACTTMGTGVGSSPSGKIRAALTWKGTDNSGNMTATLNDGQSYTGTYLQITKETRVDDLGPLTLGWGRPWREWPAWGVDPGPQFITQYSGRVVANLAGPSGTHMRCRFQLAEPASGMAGGGQGQCQLPNGQTIDTTFPTA